MAFRRVWAARRPTEVETDRAGFVASSVLSLQKKPKRSTLKVLCLSCLSSSTIRVLASKLYRT